MSRPYPPNPPPHDLFSQKYGLLQSDYLPREFVHGMRKQKLANVISLFDFFNISILYHSHYFSKSGCGSKSVREFLPSITCGLKTIFIILDLLGSKLFPGMSCKDILAKYTSPVSGTYWIKLASNKTFQVYCDMDTHEGGWTLVYSYALQITTVLPEQAIPSHPVQTSLPAAPTFQSQPPLHSMSHHLGLLTGMSGRTLERISWSNPT